MISKISLRGKYIRRFASIFGETCRMYCAYISCTRNFWFIEFTDDKPCSRHSVGNERYRANGASRVEILRETQSLRNFPETEKNNARNVRPGASDYPSHLARAVCILEATKPSNPAAASSGCIIIARQRASAVIPCSFHLCTRISRSPRSFAISFVFSSLFSLRNAESISPLSGIKRWAPSKLPQH